jgi:hypothetical protein
MSRSRTLAIPVAAVLVAGAGASIAPGDRSGATAGASGNARSDRLPQGSERVTLDPADFTTRIDNR